MALTEGNIDQADDIPAVASTTEETPHAADESSQPGPYNDLDANRPPVSTNRPDVPIAQSLVGGAGAPTGEEEFHPEEYVADNAYVSDADKDNMADEGEPKKRGPGRPKKEEA